MQAGPRLDVGQPGSERLDASSGESTAGQSQASQPFSTVTEAPRPAEGGEQADQGCRKGTQAKPQPTPCPRCQSPNTKFAYWNNYNHQQPRFFCKVRTGMAGMTRSGPEEISSSLLGSFCDGSHSPQRVIGELGWSVPGILRLSMCKRAGEPFCFLTRSQRKSPIPARLASGLPCTGQGLLAVS